MQFMNRLQLTISGHAIEVIFMESATGGKSCRVTKLSMGYSSNVTESISRSINTGIRIEVVLGMLWPYLVFIIDVPPMKVSIGSG